MRRVPTSAAPIHSSPCGLFLYESISVAKGPWRRDRRPRPHVIRLRSLRLPLWDPEGPHRGPEGRSGQAGQAPQLRPVVSPSPGLRLASHSPMAGLRQQATDTTKTPTNTFWSQTLASVHPHGRHLGVLGSGEKSAILPGTAQQRAGRKRGQPVVVTPDASVEGKRRLRVTVRGKLLLFCVIPAPLGAS
jgi:hypothetical protein